MSELPHSEPRRLGETLEQVVRALQPERIASDGNRAQSTHPVNRTSAIGGVFGRWEEAVGSAVAAHVQPLKLDGTTLVVQVDDPAWATQMRFLEATVRERLAEVAGATVERLEVRVQRTR